MTPKIIDTHAHLYNLEFKHEIDSIIQIAKDNGVSQILMPNVDIDTVQPMLDLAKNYPDFCLPMIGLHPCDVKEDYKNQLKNLYPYFKSHKIYGVGEVGLDFHWDLTYKDQQIDALKTQINWAKEFDLPLALHTRNATQEVIDILKPLKGKVKGVFHCFGGSLEQANEIIDLGFYLGIGGVVTFKNSGLDKILANIDIKNIVLETDCPYLAPVPFRGKRNEPLMIKYLLPKLSEIYNCSETIIADETSNNAKKLFNL